jgi:hypothetical protein
MLGGDDAVRFDLLNNVTTVQFLDVDLGAGNDRFDSFLNDKDLLGLGVLNITVHGGKGNDRINCTSGVDPNPEVVGALSTGLNTSSFGSFTFGAVGLFPLSLNGTPGTDISTSAALIYHLLGDQGTDQINLTHVGNVQGLLAIDVAGGPELPDGGDAINIAYSGIMQGTLSVTANGNAGNDTVVTDLGLSPGSTGKVRARVLGETGDDNLTLNIRVPPNTLLQFGTTTFSTPVNTLTIDGQLDGGPGHDTAHTLGNVAVFNVP